jgi:hypothetical protein
MISLHILLLATALVQGLPVQVQHLIPGEVPPLQQQQPSMQVAQTVGSFAVGPALVNSLAAGSAAPTVPSGYTTSYAGGGNHNHGNEDDNRAPPPPPPRAAAEPISRAPAAAPPASDTGMASSMLQYLMSTLFGGSSSQNPAQQKPQDIVSSTKSFLTFMQATGIEEDLWSMMKKTMMAYVRGGMASLTGGSAVGETKSIKYADSTKPAMLPLAGATPKAPVAADDDDEEESPASTRSQYNPNTNNANTNRPPLAVGDVNKAFGGGLLNVADEPPARSSAPPRRSGNSRNNNNNRATGTRSNLNAPSSRQGRSSRSNNNNVQRTTTVNTIRG